MSDAEHFTVTYTSISSDDGSLDVGSSRVIVLGYDGLPMMLEDPYAYVEATMQEPPPPNFVPEPVYPEFMPPKDDVLLTEEQPMLAGVSPTPYSLGYITKSDPKEDLEEGDDKDPKEDPANYPTDRDDDDDEEESYGDDTDDEEEDEGEDKEEEEEHLALIDFADVDRLLAIPTPLPSPLTSYSSPLPWIPSPPFHVPLPLTTNLTNAGAPLGYKGAMIRLRAELPFTSHPLPLSPPIVLPHTRASMVMLRAVAPSTDILAPRSKTPPSGTPPLLHIPLPTSSPPLLLPSIDCRADVPKFTLLPRKRLYIALSPRYEIRECSSASTSRPTRSFRANYGFVGTLDAEIRCDLNREIGYRITNVWEDPDEILEEIPATDMAELGIIFSYDLKKMPPRKAPRNRTIPATATATTTTSMTNVAIRELIS
uniref:Uncharacterized protein n=1 Tax=Tanacetum cinerariifolium TaxID=118510 RepID=A0A6L2JEB3_TANCI|nr:hypothetical protein [Tanacetum cinerariifolium]